MTTEIAQPPGPKSSGERHYSSLVELVLIVAAAVLLAIGVQAVLVKPYRIPSQSMEPTLDIGQRVLVSRINYRFGSPSRGDIVVFHPPAGSDTNQCGVQPRPGSACSEPTEDRKTGPGDTFIKRIVAVGGDSLAIRAGYAVVNGRLQKASYIKPCVANDPNCDRPRPIKVPPGHFFMMGDNRGESDDSRYWGPVPKKWIIGQAFATYWPPRRVGFF